MTNYTVSKEEKKGGSTTNYRLVTRSVTLITSAYYKQVLSSNGYGRENTLDAFTVIQKHGVISGTNPVDFWLYDDDGRIICKNCVTKTFPVFESLFSPWSLPTTRSHSDMSSILINKALRNFNTDGLSLMTFFGELPETIRYVGDRVGTLVKFARDIRRFRNPFRGTNIKDDREYASAWLEYRYAAMPLVYDCYAFMKLKEEGLSIPQVTQKVRHTFSEPRQQWENSLVKANYSAVWQGQVENSWKGTYKATYRLANAELAYMSSLGLVNPALTAWELVPLSFVVDWFIPVGDFINSLASTAGWERLESSVTTTRMARLEASAKVSDGTRYRFSGNASPLKTAYIQKKRVVNPSHNVLTLIPELAMNSSRIIDGIALLSVLLPRSKRQEKKRPFRLRE